MVVYSSPYLILRITLTFLFHVYMQSISLQNMDVKTFLLWPPCVADADIIFSSCGFFFLSSSFFLAYSQQLQLDVYHTSTHDVALVQI